VDLGLDGRVALVTGASRGIGRASAVALAAEGACVFAVARDEARLAELAAAHPGSVAYAVSDLSTDDGCEVAAAAATRKFGTVDVLVNCAGAATMGNVLDLSREQIDSALRLKFHSYLRLSQLVAPGMKQRRWGRIVNIAGSAGTSPTAGNLPTSLANIAVHNATRALSDELAPHGILVNLISPGLTLTDRARTLFAQQAKADGVPPEELIAATAAALPAQRAAGPDEVARAVCFLASAACSYVFGSVLYMDGAARRATP
jgi:NAD(P)-dependent dehydrogenase (short-subunit alcohol dehydrogenase family)